MEHHGWFVWVFQQHLLKDVEKDSKQKKQGKRSNDTESILRQRTLDEREIIHGGGIHGAVTDPQSTDGGLSRWRREGDLLKLETGPLFNSFVCGKDADPCSFCSAAMQRTMH